MREACCPAPCTVGNWLSVRPPSTGALQPPSHAGLQLSPGTLFSSLKRSRQLSPGDLPELGGGAPSAGFKLSLAFEARFSFHLLTGALLGPWAPDSPLHLIIPASSCLIPFPHCCTPTPLHRNAFIPWSISLQPLHWVRERADSCWVSFLN